MIDEYNGCKIFLLRSTNYEVVLWYACFDKRINIIRVGLPCTELENFM